MTPGPHREELCSHFCDNATEKFLKVTTLCKTAVRVAGLWGKQVSGAALTNLVSVRHRGTGGRGARFPTHSVGSDLGQSLAAARGSGRQRVAACGHCGVAGRGSFRTQGSGAQRVRTLVYAYVAPFGLCFSVFKPVLSLTKSLSSKHKMCVMLTLFPKVSALLEKIHVFKANVRAEWTVLVSLTCRLS